MQNDYALQVATSFDCKLPMIPKKGKIMYPFKFNTPNPFDVKTAKLQIELMKNCATQDTNAQLEIDLDLKFKYKYKVKHELRDHVHTTSTLRGEGGLEIP